MGLELAWLMCTRCKCICPSEPHTIILTEKADISTVCARTSKWNNTEIEALEHTTLLS